MFTTWKAQWQSHKQKRFYQKRFYQHGPSLESLHWANLQNQTRRFEPFLQFGDIQSHTVLDVGCGLGDFYSFLRQNHQKPLKYLGLDIVPEFTSFAQERFPETRFACHDLLAKPLNETFDYSFASGLFAFANLTFFKVMIKEMWDHTNQGLCFNLHHATDDQFFKFSESEITSVIKKLRPNMIFIKHDKKLRDTNFFITKIPLEITSTP